MTVTNQHQKTKAALLRTPLFQDSSASFVDKITLQSKLIQADKGKVLFLHEDRAEYFYIITRGWVKLFRETLDGTQAVIDILTKDHVFGEMALFQNNIYTHSAEVSESAELIRFPLSLLKCEIEDNPKMAMTMLSSMAHHRQFQDQELEHRTIQNAAQRIGCFLLRLADQKQKGAVTLHLPYDKTLVASRLGMQPETFSRALGKLKKETGIHVKGATIKMDSLDQLVRYSCSACSSGFPCGDLMSGKKLVNLKT